jgi:hypothetical protein
MGALSSSGAGNRHKPLLTARCALVQIADEADDVGQRAADPVEFPHDQRVALPRHLKRLRQARAVGCAARADVVVDPLAPNARERVTLEVEALLARRHAHVADQHPSPRAVLHQPTLGKVYRL